MPPLSKVATSNTNEIQTRPRLPQLRAVVLALLLVVVIGNGITISYGNLRVLFSTIQTSVGVQDQAIASESKLGENGSADPAQNIQRRESVVEATSIEAASTTNSSAAKGNGSEDNPSKNDTVGIFQASGEGDTAETGNLTIANLNDPLVDAFDTLRTYWDILESNDTTKAGSSGYPEILGTYLVEMGGEGGKGRRMEVPQWLLPSPHESSISDNANNNTQKIVLVTHVSANKLDRIQTEMEFWNGPASVAVYVKSQKDLASFQEHLTKNYDSLYKTTTTWHVVLEVVTGEPKLLYPHNILRNLALHHMIPHQDDGLDYYYLALDADFIPGPKNAHATYDRLLTLDASLEVEMKKGRLMIIPAFDIEKPPNAKSATVDQLPLSRGELAVMVQTKHTAEGFAQSRFPGGHKLTDFTKWLDNQRDADGAAWYPTQWEKQCEPYVWGYYNRQNPPPHYWPHFRGFGQNKQSWFLEWKVAGAEFGVLWDVWVAHLSHAPPNGKNHASGVNMKIFHTFAAHLVQNYNSSVVNSMWFCSDGMSRGVCQNSTVAAASLAETQRMKSLVPAS